MTNFCRDCPGAPLAHLSDMLSDPPGMASIARAWLLLAMVLPCRALLSGTHRPAIRPRCLPSVCVVRSELRPGEDLWAIVGTHRHATDAELRRAFRRQARRLHPDMGGDARSFRRLVSAHNILSNRSSREAWERHATTAQQTPQWERPSSSGRPDQLQAWLSAVSSIAYMYATWATLLWAANHVGSH